MPKTYPLAVSATSFHSSDEALEHFLQFVKDEGLNLYESQEEAILEIFSGNNVILNTPTGSGKSLVAAALHFHSMSSGRRSYYTSPIKALVNEKFVDLCRRFGPGNVGMVTGDASVNHKAPIICCTAEILANIGLREGERAVIHDVVMDEFHYYSDKDRGSAWQIPLLTLPQCRFLLMSATMGDTDFFAKEMTNLNHRESSIVSSSTRPVPLEFAYSEESLTETIGDLLKAGRAPIYLVNFSQHEAAQNAQNFMSINLTTKEEKKQISQSISSTEFKTPFGKEIKRFLQHGIGVHHAGLLPKYRILVEKLAQQGLLKLISGTDTLGVGVNVPIRTVVFTQLCKFDGVKTGLLTVRDFHQIAGRAGRKGYDDKGWVIAQAPAHVIENLKMERKAAINPKAKKKMVKAKPPTKGFVQWNEDTFLKLRSSPPEPLRSQFQISHATLVQVLGRASNGCQGMKDLLKKCHESKKSKMHLIRHSWQLFRALLDKKIVEFIPEDERINTPIRVNVDLQDDFSLNQALGLFLLDALRFIDPMDSDYDLKLLSLTESILENPSIILRKQLDKVKREKLAELKEQGLDYDERMEELEKLEYPKPMAEYIYTEFNRFADKQPWIGQENIRPKGIAREMYENYSTFSEYIKEYGIERAEGVLLRYVSDVYKVLAHTVPDHLKNDSIDEMIVYFEHMIQQTDSSIVEEWKKLNNPNDQLVNSPQGDQDAKAEIQDDITQPQRKFEIRIRNFIFHIIRLIKNKNWEEMRQQFLNGTEEHMQDKALEEIIKEHSEEHGQISTHSAARANDNTIFNSNNQEFLVQQTIFDSSDFNDWQLCIEIDVKKTQTFQKIQANFKSIGPLNNL